MNEPEITEGEAEGTRKLLTDIARAAEVYEAELVEAQESVEIED